MRFLTGRDFRGWLRAARVARVLGLFSLYLFLDTYDVRADFNRRAVARLRDRRAKKAGELVSKRGSRNNSMLRLIASSVCCATSCFAVLKVRRRNRHDSRSRRFGCESR